MSETEKPKHKPSTLPRERILSTKIIVGGAHALLVRATCVRLPIYGPDGIPVMTEFVIGARNVEQVQNVVENLRCWNETEKPRDPLDPTLIPEMLIANKANFNLDEEL